MQFSLSEQKLLLSGSLKGEAYKKTNNLQEVITVSQTMRAVNINHHQK